MKTILIEALLTGLAVAHSGVWHVDVDGVDYPARDTRMDGKIGARRIEWSFKDSGAPWGPVGSVNGADFTCGRDAKYPALKAVARAGAQVTVQWSGIVRTHYGPTMSYLAYVPTPNTKPQDLSFFKIDGKGYNTQTKLWANEQMIKDDRKNTIQLPSDIKPGMYVLRTELLALHYSNTQGPQFYPHCFNIQINGTGTVSPPGVKFPGGYKANDPSLVGNLYNSAGQPLNWDKYVIPGPPKYAGQYGAPTGPAPVVAEKDRGVFPPEFEAKYEAFKKKVDQEALTFNDKLNAAQDPLGHGKVKSEANLQPIFAEHFGKQKGFEQEIQKLKQEAIKLGVADVNGV